MNRKLSTTEVAKMLDVSPRTLYTWRQKGIGPEFFQPAPGCNVVYSRDEVERWIKSRTGKKVCEAS